MDSPARREASILRKPGRRRPARRLLPVPDYASQRYAPVWRPFARLRGGIDARSVPSHIQLHDRSHFNAPVDLQDWTALREFHRLLQVAGLDECVTADNVLGFGKGSIRHGLLLALHQLAGALERLSLVLNVSLLAELLEPCHPLLH